MTQKPSSALFVCAQFIVPNYSFDLPSALLLLVLPSDKTHELVWQPNLVTCVISFWEVNIYGTFLSQLSVWFSGRSIWSAARRGWNMRQSLPQPYFFSDTISLFHFWHSIFFPICDFYTDGNIQQTFLWHTGYEWSVPFSVDFVQGHYVVWL